MALGDGGGPPIVAVVIVDEVRPDLSLTLESIAAQEYTNFSVLVIDAAGEEPIADRVAEILPDAFLHRMPNRPGRSAAANQALELVSGASFFLFVTVGHMLDPSATSTLIEELYRSNAGIVTPKVVDARDPRRLRKVGMGSDRFGVQVDLVEPGEFDQEQYDTVRDVFVAPAGVQLIRADLFRALGGFDPVMARYGADLDLCWRAHVAGARVVAVPRAVVRVASKEADSDERRRQLGRNRLRTLLVASTTLHLLRVMPFALLLLVAEVLYSVIAGRRRQARDALGAIGWNLANLADIRRRRKQMAALRGVSDREVVALQVPGSARLSGFLRGQFDVGDRVVSFAGTFRDSFTGQDAGAFRDGFVISALVGVVILLGSRGLITGGVTPTGQFLDLPGGGVLLREWLGGWRSVGTGGTGNPATAFGVLGVAKLVFFWGRGVFDTLLVIGPLFIGPFGAWRLARSYGSLRGAALAALAYAANPLAVSAMASARWDSLVVYGAGPFLAGSALRIQGSAPFGPIGGAVGPGVVERSLPIRLLRFGLLVAAVAIFVPAVVVVAVLFCAGLLVSGVVMARPGASGRLALASVVAVVVPAALHAPFTFDVLQRGSWRWFVGPDSPEVAFDSLADLIRFAPGGVEPRLLTIGIIAAASLVLLIGNGVRLDAGIRAWSLAVVSWVVIWVGRRGWIDVELPAVEMMLVPAATGMAMAIGAATRAVEIDLVGFRFGWRQVAAFLGIFAMAGAGILLLTEAYGGRWKMPEQSYANTTALLAEQLDGPSRILWIGAPSVLPVDTIESDRGISYAFLEGTEASVLGRWMPGAYGLDRQVGEQLDLAIDDQTVRLGRLLAPYGIDYLVVVPRLAPAPHEGRTIEPPAGLMSALFGQLDLQRVAGVADFTVFRNEAALGPVVGLETDIAGLPNRPEAFLDTDLTNGQRMNGEFAPGEWSVSASAPRPDGSRPPQPVSVLVAVTGDGWVSATDGVTVAPTAGGLLAVDPGEITEWGVRRPTPWLRWLGLVAQAGVVGVGIAIARSEDPVT